MIIEASWESRHITNQNEELGNQHSPVWSILSMYVSVVSILYPNVRIVRQRSASIIGLQEMSLPRMLTVAIDTHLFCYSKFKLQGTQLMRFNKTVCQSGLRGPRQWRMRRKKRRHVLLVGRVWHMSAMKLPTHACGLLCRSLCGQAMHFDLGSSPCSSLVLSPVTLLGLFCLSPRKKNKKSL